MENSDTQQVVQAVNLPEAATDSLMLSKLVTFALLMVWLGLTASAFYLRSFVFCLHTSSSWWLFFTPFPFSVNTHTHINRKVVNRKARDLYSADFLAAMMSISLAGPVFAFLLKGNGICILALCVATATAFFLYLGYSQHYRQTAAAAGAQSSAAGSTVANLCQPKSTSAAHVMANIGLLLCIGSALPAYFFCANAVIRREQPVTTHDDELVKADTALLGWLFPMGQLSLFLDQSPLLSPESAIGSFVGRFLSVVYVSYYFYGYAMVGFSAIIWIYQLVHNGRNPKTDRFWRACEQVAACWTFSFMFTFLLNTLVPARSPRLYLKDKFKHSLLNAKKAADGTPAKPSAFNVWLHKTIHQDNTYGSFPSGHVGETLSVAIAGKVVGKQYSNKFLSVSGDIVMVVSFFMASATLWLRYHYFADVLVAIGVASFSMVLAHQLHKLTYTSETAALPLSDKAAARAPSPAVVPSADDEESSKRGKRFTDAHLTNLSTVPVDADFFPRSIEEGAHEA